jgi:hypothetical protein
VRWLQLVPFVPFVPFVIACAPTESMPDRAPNPTPEKTPTAAPQPEPVPESAPIQVAPGCDATTIAAAHTALATAIAKHVDASVLADCQPEQIICETERRPLERTQSCQMFAYQGNERWEIVILPRPTTGAPTQIEVWVDQAGSEAGRVDISGSTLAVVEGVIIEGHGAPARIGGATFMVENRRDQAVDLKLTGTRWLVDHSCELPRTEQARPKPAGLALEDGLVDGKMTVTIPAGASTTVSLGHAVQDAYMAYCDRFATAASFEIGGDTVEVIAEHHVIRREPLRRP